MADITALIRRAAKTAGVPVGLFDSLIRNGERSYQGWQNSPAGAFGPSQLMPGTASGLAQKYGVNTNTVEGNLLGGAYYLKEQLQRFGGNPRKAVAAYNAGPGNVEKYGGVPPFKETQAYVSRVLGGAGRAAVAVSQPLGLTDLGNRKIGSVTLRGPASTRMVSAPPPDLTSLLTDNLGKIAQGWQPTDVLGATAPSLLEAWMTPSTVVPVKGASYSVPLTAPRFGVAPTAPRAASARTAPSSHPSAAPLGHLPAVIGNAQGINEGFMGKVLRAVQALGGTQIRINSGYRSPEHNAAVGGVAHSNHVLGHAIDGEVLIGGQWQPIGRALKPVAARFGLRSGDQPGFYRGGTDPVHIDDGWNLR